MADANDALATAPRKKGLFSAAFAWLMMGAAFAWAKGKVVLLILMKSAIFAPLLTFFLSLGAYGLFLGWLAGLGIMIHLLVHEFGHFFAGRAVGVKVSLPMFNPLFGAWVKHEVPRSDFKNAIISLGGPAAGIALSLACLAYWMCAATHPAFWLWMGAIGLMLNVSNLIPVQPLDGGHVLSKFWPDSDKYIYPAMAFLVPAFGSQELDTLLLLFVFMVSSEKRTNAFYYALAAGFGLAAVVWGPLWYLILAAAFVSVNFLPYEAWARAGWMRFFSMVFGKRAARKTASDETVNEQLEPAENAAVTTDATAIAAEPAPPSKLNSPEFDALVSEVAEAVFARQTLSPWERILIGTWYIVMAAGGGALLYWTYTMSALTLPH